jgi:hypothetical protein
MIQHASFKHGWFYHYRVHVPKTQTLLSDFPQLSGFLNEMFTGCPHDKFLSGPRSSKLRFTVPVDLVELPGHEICTMTKNALQYADTKTAHTVVEMGLLTADSKTISVEVPLWLDSHELENYETIFGCTDALTGHIDILRYENGKVWIWDYKPGAAKEKWAATQLNCYATMLSKRTGIPLTEFMCGYFDADTSFVFKPVPL